MVYFSCSCLRYDFNSVACGSWRRSRLNHHSSSLQSYPLIDTDMLRVLGTHTVISLLHKQPQDEGTIDSLASGWLLMVKVFSLRPRSVPPPFAEWVLSFSEFRSSKRA